MDNKYGNNPVKRSEDYTVPSFTVNSGVHSEYNEKADSVPASAAQQTSVQEGNISVHFNEAQKEVPLSDAEVENITKLNKKEMSIYLQIGIVALAALVVFLLIRYISKETNVTQTSVSTTQIVSAISTTAINGTSSTFATVPTTEIIVTTADSVTKKEERTTVAATKETTSSGNVTDSGSVKSKTKQEIISYFNESSNRVKTEAAKIVKNFENRTHNEDKLELPSAIKNIAKGILESKITDIPEPVEYSSREAIVGIYPVPGQEWSSKLSSEDVKTAVCVENGNEYEITITLNTCTDPEPGKGTSKAMDCLDVPTVRDTAPPFITGFSAEYYDCVIRCRVDKETGRIIWSNYTTPVVIKIGLDAGFVNFDAQIGITFEKDYSITY